MRKILNLPVGQVGGLHRAGAKFRQFTRNAHLLSCDSLELVLLVGV